MMLWNIQQIISKKEFELKVKIGPFRNTWTTSRLEDFWYRIRYGKDENRWSIDDDKMDSWDHRAEAVFDIFQTILNATINKIEFKRNIKVKIDRHDIWATDYHLALIILPMLQELRSRHHGAPHIDDEDVPEHLRSTAAPAKENDWDTDDNFFLRYEWILDELVWTFTQLSIEDWDSQFYSRDNDNPDLDMIGNWKINREAYDIHNKRINNGTRLFGKYMRTLSD